MNGSDRRILAMIFWVLMRGILMIIHNSGHIINRTLIKILNEDTIQVSNMIDRWVNGYDVSDTEYKALVKRRDG